MEEMIDVLPALANVRSVILRSAYATERAVT